METKNLDLPKVKNKELLLQLHNYLNEHNLELYNFLLEQQQLKEFLINRTNQADEQYVEALSRGIPSPKEVCNQVLYKGLENSYSEYIEDLYMEFFPDVYRHLDSLTQEKKSPLFNIILCEYLPIFWENIDNYYVDIQEKLDESILKKTNELIESKFFVKHGIQ